MGLPDRPWNGLSILDHSDNKSAVHPVHHSMNGIIIEILLKFWNNKVRKIFFTVILLFINLFSFAEGRDIIVMIDISASMSPYYEDVLSYFNDNLLQKYVRQGDTLTILSFSSFPETEIIKEIIDIESYRTVLNTVAYSKPFGLHTDLVSAIKYLYQVAAKLPETRKKKIFLITDGIHDPPAGSPYVISSDVTVKELLKNSRAIRKAGWSVHILQIPGGDIASESNFMETLIKELEAEVTLMKPPEDESIIRTQEEKEEEKEEKIEEEKEETAPSSIVEEKEIFLLPIISIDVNMLISFLIIVAAVILLLLLLFLLIRYLYFRIKYPEKRKLVRKRKAVKKRGKAYSGLIEMRAYPQNPNIGMRNIHHIPEGGYRTIGGGRSNYLIFIVPFPHRIAEIHFDGTNYIFKPVKGEFFPELEGPIQNCLNKNIPSVSAKGFPIFIRFRKYISPTELVNILLKSFSKKNEENK